MNNPNLIIPGFPKSGTSSLHFYLSQHDEILPGKFKEPHTYSHDDKYSSRFDPNIKTSFYQIYGKPWGGRYIIDASTSYMISEVALERIKEDCPNAKLIIVARDPVDRIISHYKWIASMGNGVRSFKEEVLLDSQSPRWHPKAKVKNGYKNYLQYSMYGSQLQKAYSIFQEEQVYFVKFEILFKRLEGELSKILNFLELEPLQEVAAERKNKTEPQVALPDNYRKLTSLIPQNAKTFIRKKFIQHKIFLTPIPEVLDSELDVLKPFLELEVKKLEDVGVSLDHWHKTQSLLR